MAENKVSISSETMVAAIEWQHVTDKIEHNRM